MPATSPRVRPSAADTYAAHYAAILARLEQLGESFADIPAPSDEFSPHWGHVGTLAEIDYQLAELLEFAGTNCRDWEEDRFRIVIQPAGEIVDRHCTRREASAWVETYNENAGESGRHAEAVPESSGGKGGAA